MKNGVRYALFLAVLVAALLEILTRLPAFTPSFEMFGLQILLDREQLYRIQPECREDINAFGLRDDPISPKPDDVKRILFYGDSFVLGLNVASELTLPNQLERRMDRTDVVNLGSHGFGPDQALLRFIDEADDLDPDAVILALFPGNDFADVVKNRLFRIDEDGNVVRTESNPVSEALPRSSALYWIDYLRYRWRLRGQYDSTYEYVFGTGDRTGERYLELFKVLFDDTVDPDFLLNPEAQRHQDSLTLTKEVLKRFRDECAQRDLPFTVVVIPSYFNVQDRRHWASLQVPRDRLFAYENAALQMCRVLGIPAINLYPDLLKQREGGPLFNQSDLHLTERGNDVAASIILDHLISPVSR